VSGASIAAEVDAALQSLAPELGSGAFSIELLQTTGEPENPWEADTSAITATVVAGNVQMYPRAIIDGTLIQTDDRKVMLAATGPRPTTADRLRIGGVEHKIINVDELAPQRVPIYYIVQVRI